MSESEVVDLATVALRQNAVFVPKSSLANHDSTQSKSDSDEQSPGESILKLTTELAKIGFGMDEKLFHSLDRMDDSFHAELLQRLRTIVGMDKNWTPLTKDWKVPTNETILDYFRTFVSTVLQTPGVEMPCGHIIPDGSFPLERYNGCPFCKTPFEFAEIENVGQGSKLKVLQLWTESNTESFFHDLLRSRTPLDATQGSSLKFLLEQYELPSPLEIGMKETMALVVDSLVSRGMDDRASVCFRSPTDILRYLWYKKTGFIQLVKPKTVVRKKVSNALTLGEHTKTVELAVKEAASVAETSLKLKYTRPECRRVAKWINSLPMEVEAMVEAMHPQRGMWVRFIRALRLSEFGKRPEYPKLGRLMDVFHDQNYEVWLGEVSKSKLQRDMDSMLKLLQQRPGAFSRCLFANMLWFESRPVLASFAEVANKVPARLLLTLAMYAELYFDPSSNRVVRALGGDAKSIPANPMLQRYTEEQLGEMIEQVQSLALSEMRIRFGGSESSAEKMYIAPELYMMPLPIGDRSESIQSLPVSLMGTRFPVEGDSVRLFMSWGKGLPAQHLDMDLSCRVAYDNVADNDFCSYSQLTVQGCQHSGDVINIPEQVGTAEYIELDLAELQRNNARYVVFTCNAYSRGELALDLVVGWMNSDHPMEISEKSGVAYDPSCVQHQVQISQTLSKGLVFGVLDVAASEIVWLEMPFAGQVTQRLDLAGVKSMLRRLNSKMTVGELLRIKAEAQNLELVAELSENEVSNSAIEVFDLDWARNSAAVTQLMVD